jgi:hypothetical protein
VERARADARELAPRLDEPALAELAAGLRTRGRDRHDVLAGG